MNDSHIPENNNVEHAPEVEQAAVDTTAQELQQAKERLSYLMAEFDNYKRRTEKERIVWMDLARKDMVVDFLPIVDNLESALGYHAGSSEADEKNLRNGVELIYKSFQKVLAKNKVEEVPSQKTFDPEKHEALMTVESADHESGDIETVLEKGFTFKGAVVRPAKVSVAQ